ncbi:Aste57867_8773 [Aphanomyces stellatus]|uniref:Aste57867_8773 protein n=1 Tax=Aphanomyces stellatus TaxID=120398 RepID=A0A485KL79_9STRA|nr:hypothetical protein As57867_008739 [Aphanomyces stellatus]VFT85659.1 Aste57867_8773 [Aphanomyces stellatus]
MTTSSYADTIDINVVHHVQDKPVSPPVSPTRAAKDPWKIAAVYAAFIVFGLGSWIMTNSVFIEIAALFQHVPEKSAISAYLIVALQAANIFPMLYMAFNGEQQLFSIRQAIWVLLALGVGTCVLLSLFWDRTSVFWGHEHSTGMSIDLVVSPHVDFLALLSLVFFGGAVSATTTVVYYPFVSSFPPVFTSALATGEGLSGVVAGVLGIIQDPGSATMNMSVSVFFISAGSVFAIAMVAFWFLTHSTTSREVQHSMYTEDPGEYDCKFTPPVKRVPSRARDHESVPLVSPGQKQLPIHHHHNFQSSTNRRDYVLRKLWKPLVCQVLLCAMSFGVVPSIMPFLGSKYINSAQVLKWSSVLSMACDPLARFLTSFYRWYNVSALCVATLVLGLAMTISSTASHPLFSTFEYGGVAPVVANCIFVFLFAYTQTMIYLTLKREVRFNESYAKTAYQWSGFLTQMGALAGTIVIFPLVTYTTWFQTSYGQL